MLNKDNIWVGVILGILIPVLAYGLFYGFMEISSRKITYEVFEKMQLVLIALNAIAMRHFLIKRQQDQIGRGILFVTFLLVIYHFAKYYTELL